MGVRIWLKVKLGMLGVAFMAILGSAYGQQAKVTSVKGKAQDLQVQVDIPAAGVYSLTSEGEVTDLNKIKAADKTGMVTLYATIEVRASRPTKRIVFDSFRGAKQDLGKFYFEKGKQTVNMLLPADFKVKAVSIHAFVPPVVPLAAENYKPRIVPPAGHPRLWVNNESLLLVKGRLKEADHLEAWEKVKALALQPVQFTFDPDKETFYDEKLERAIEAKAFYYLMSDDQKIGKEAVVLADQYLEMLEFGNVSYGDITRELGRAIYTGALVYDWCYALLDMRTKTGLHKNMMRLAQDMEIGWPPFYGIESIINGHGNEAQISRDLLAMSIALYDEDPVPYKYTSYSILEELVPMRKFEYQSPRHNQGVDYGGYRFGWEMHGAWLFDRMLGYPVFDDNIKNMPYYWLYMRTPDGKMLRDGDMFNVKYNSSDDFYWKNPQTMLLCYAYSGDPVIKAEFIKQGSLPDNPILFLLLDDPKLKPDFGRDKMPLTKDFGPI